MADPRLENYLSTLDRSLRSLSVSDRADIVTEIKSHVLSAMERDPNQSIDSVLASLGEPEVVANRYLLERGLKPGKPPISPIVKWIVIGFLGTMALFLAGLVVLAIYLSPVVKVDSEKQQVHLFGGLVQVDDDDIKVGSQKLTKFGNHSFSGRADKPGRGKTTAISLTNGKLQLITSADGILHWDCRGTENAENQINPGSSGDILDLTSHGFVKCEISVPEGASVTISGANGKIGVERPRFNVSAELANGAADIQPIAGVRYEYDLGVTNGKMGSFVSEPNPEYKIRIRLINGKISN